MFRILLEFEVTLELSPPHQILESDISDAFTGLIGLEVTGGDIIVSWYGASLNTSSLFDCSLPTEESQATGAGPDSHAFSGALPSNHSRRHSAFKIEMQTVLQ